MREIKFRAWSTATKKMYKPFDMKWFVIGNEHPEDWLNDFCFSPENGLWPEGTQFMQYTGLHDKNGKEIYEGDILKLRTQRFPVEWEHNGDMIYEWTGFPLSYSAKECEVIGNIYEGKVGEV